MAHELEFDANGKACMAYVGDMPWHGYGESIEGIPTPDEMQAKAKLDWKVLSRAAGFPIGDGKWAKIDGFKTLVRSTDNKPLSVVSDDYHVVQNSEMFAFFRHWCDAGEMRMHTAGALDGGKVIWVLAEIDAGFQICLDGNLMDRTKMFCLMSSGHKPGFALQIDLTSVRVVCMNTLRMARGNGKPGSGRYRHVHNTAWDESKQQAATEMVMAAKQAAEDFHQHAEMLSKLKVPHAVTEAFIVELLQPQLLAEVKGKLLLDEIADGGYSDTERELKLGAAFLNGLIGGKASLNPEKFSRPVKQVLQAVDKQPGAYATRGSLWGDLQAVTYWTDHERGRNVDTRLTSAWYGESAKVKESALDLALTYSERLAAV